MVSAAGVLLLVQLAACLLVHSTLWWSTHLYRCLLHPLAVAPPCLHSQSVNVGCTGALQREYRHKHTGSSRTLCQLPCVGGGGTQAETRK